MPEISIVVPVYNSEKYLKQTIDSILNQTFKDFELLAIDDNSSDNSPEILKNYNDERLKIFKNPSKGAYSARNYGLKEAKGKYITFLDSDDLFKPDFLEKLHSKAIEFAADLVVCSSKCCDEDNIIIQEKNPIWPLDLENITFNKPFNYKDVENIFTLFCVVPWNKLYLKSMLLDNNLQFQNSPPSDDVSFSHKVRLSAKKIVVIEDELVIYRQLKQGSQSAKRGQNAPNVIKALIETRNFLEEKGLWENLKKSFIEAFINHISHDITPCNNEQYQKFLNEFKKMPDWELFKDALKKNYITLDYIYNLIGEKKVMLWGASEFLRNLLKDEKQKNENILGIIDKNVALQGDFVGNYQVFAPSILNEIKPDCILMTIVSRHKKVHAAIKEELKEFRVKLLEDIF